MSDRKLLHVRVINVIGIIVKILNNRVSAAGNGYIRREDVRALATSRIPFDQDDVIHQVRQQFQCTILWCEGRPCLEYDHQEELERIADYIHANYHKELLDVFFSAIERLPQES